jgi:Mg-chelatase subunit ChlD
LEKDKKLERWRLILGKPADPEGGVPLEGTTKKMDKVLDALYDSNKKGGLGSSSPNINRWLGDIRKYFPTTVVQLMQRDALERLDLKRMLLEPELLESIEPDVHLAGTILSLNQVLPDETQASARMVVQKIVDQLLKQLSYPLAQAIKGSIDRSSINRRPKFTEINWNRTILKNLKHYQPEYRTIIPEQLIGYGRKKRQLKDVIILVDQSGSMASSVVYSAIMGSILSSIPTLRTQLVAFDTSVVDLTAYLHDPVGLLFAAQLGGGTNIAKVLSYAMTLFRKPEDTILILISDLFEGGREEDMLAQVARIKAAGVQMISLLALNDEGAPAYSRRIAAQLSNWDIPTFACTPNQFPGLMAAAIRNDNIYHWMNSKQIAAKG